MTLKVNFLLFALVLIHCGSPSSVCPNITDDDRSVRINVLNDEESGRIAPTGRLDAPNDESASSCKSDLLVFLESESSTKQKRETRNLDEKTDCEPSAELITLLTRALKYFVNSLTHAGTYLHETVGADDVCSSKVKEFHDILEGLKENVMYMSKLDITDDEFEKRKNYCIKKIKALKKYIETLRTNSTGNIALQFKYLLLETVTLKEHLELVITNIKTQRNSIDKIRMSPCVAQILVGDSYSECESISNLKQHKVFVLRSIIESSYNDDFQRLSQILKYIANLSNPTHALISYEALVEELLTTYQIIDPRVLEIYNKIEHLMQLPDFQSSVPEQNQVRARLLQKLFSRAIESFVISWAEESEDDEFGNISSIARDCPTCLDLIESTTSDLSVLGRVVQSVYSNNSEKISSILNLVSKLQSVPQKMQCFETLINEMSTYNNTKTPMLFAIDSAFDRLLESAEYLQSNSSDIQKRSSTLKSILSQKVSTMLKTWSSSIRNNEFSAIFKFSKVHPAVFEKILHDLLRLAYSNNDHNVIPMLRFASRLAHHSVKFGVETYRILINETISDTRLKSPIVFVIDDALRNLLSAAQNLSMNVTDVIVMLRDCLSVPVRDTLVVWAGLIAKEQFSVIDDFSIENPEVFDRLLEELVPISFDNKTEMVVPMLKFGLHFSIESYHSINTYRILIEQMAKDQSLNSNLVFIVDYFVDKFLKELSVKAQEIASQLLKATISKSYEHEIEKWSALILQNNIVNIKQFATQYPGPFEELINQLITKSYSRNEDNIYPIVLFIDKLENINHTTFCYISFVSYIIENDLADTPMIFVLNEHLESLIENPQYNNVVADFTKLQVSQLKSNLTQPIMDKISEWSEQIKANIFGNILNFAKSHSNAFTRVLRKLVQKSVDNNEESMLQNLEFAQQLDANHHSVYLETLLESVGSNEETNKVSRIVLQTHLQSIIDNHDSGISRYTQLHVNKFETMNTDIAGSVRDVLSSLVSTMGKSDELTNYANEHGRIFEFILPRLISAAFKNNLDNVVKILNFCMSLSNISRELMCYQSLINMVEKDRKLRSYVVFVIDDYLDQFKTRTLQGNHSREFQLEISRTKNQLSPSCEHVISNWSYLISQNNFTEIQTFARKFNSLFKRLNVKFVSTAFAKYPYSINSILCYCVKIKDKYLSLSSYSLLVERAKSPNINSYLQNQAMVLVVDDYLNRRHGSAIGSHVELLRSSNLIPCQSDLTAWIAAVLQDDTLMKFARQSAKDFENLIGLLVKINYALNKRNIRSVLQFGLQLENVSQNILVFLKVTDISKDSKDFDFLHTFELGNYIDQVTIKPGYEENISARMKDEISNTLKYIETVTESTIVKIASLIETAIDSAEIKFVIQHLVILDRMLSRIVIKAHSGIEARIIPILKFAKKVPDSYRVKLYDTLVTEIQKNATHTTPLVLVVQDDVQSFKNKTNFSDVQDTNRLNNVAFNLSALSNNVLSKWASEIRMNKFQNALDFASAYKSTMKFYLSDLVSLVYANDSKNALVLISLLTKVEDAELVEVLYKNLYSNMKENLVSEEGLQLAIWAKTNLDARSKGLPHNTKSDLRESLKQSFPSGAQFLLFSEHITLFNLKHRVFLSVRQDGKRLVTRRNLSDGAGYWKPQLSIYNDKYFEFKYSGFNKPYLYGSNAAVSVTGSDVLNAVWKIIPVKLNSTTNAFHIRSLRSGFLNVVQNTINDKSDEMELKLLPTKDKLIPQVWIISDHTTP